MTSGPARDRWLFWLCVALSLALHAGLAAYLFWSERGKFGAVEQPTAAISVNLVSSDILDAAEQSLATEAASAPAAPSAAVPPPEPDPPKPEAEPQLAEDKPVEAEPQFAAEDTPPAAAEAAAEVERQRIAEAASQRDNAAELEQQKAEQRARGEAIRQAENHARLEREDAREAERRQRAEQRDKAQKQPAKPRNHAASAGASGSRGAAASKGRISASQGSVRNYGGIVNAWIARNKPSHSGVTGTVVVLLAISPAGNLISARVVSSSGNAMLDRSALAAVRRSSPFPPPPAGAKAGDLVFKYPCYFR